MQPLRLLRDFLLVHRRAIAGMCNLIAAGVLLVIFSGELERFYRDLFQLQERNAPFLYLMFSGLLVLAFLTSIFPALLFGVLGGMLFGIVDGSIICAASLLAAALIAFLFARYFFRTASRRIAARFLDSIGWRRAFGAVPITTTVVGDAEHAAVVALLDMSTERRGTASFDCSHDAVLVG
jgi:uncharacterized membrane protein YdjX (TVP38/TMEM64 family)